MLTWDEWFTYLHGLIDPRASHHAAEIGHYHALIELCRSQMSLPPSDLRARALDELWQVGLRLIDQALQDAEEHQQTAGALNARWQKTQTRSTVDTPRGRDGVCRAVGQRSALLVLLPRNARVCPVGW